MKETSSIVEHYGTGDLTNRVAEALRSAGLGDGTIPWQALAPLDQFHVRGMEATTELAARLALSADKHVLDVGSGLGGPARHLAADFGCRVTGIDLSKPFVDVAEMLTNRTGLSAKVHFLNGDALHLPFDPQTFDAAITQHVGMNIGDREALYTGIFRVLRRGGRLAIYDVVAGDGGALQFPLPWARVPENSFVISADETKAALKKSGFAIGFEADRTDAGIAFFQNFAAAQASGQGLPALGLGTIMGADTPVLLANLGRNLKEGRARLLEIVAERAQ